MKLITRIQPLLERMGFEFREGPKSTLFAEQAIDPFLRLLTQLGDPDQILLQAGITRQKLRVLTGDDEISGAMDTRRDAIHAIPWRLQPGDFSEALDREKLPEPVQWMWTQFERHAEKVIGSCMEALPYGYSVQEAVYMRDSLTGRVTWADVSEKPFEWFIPKCDGTVLWKSWENPIGEVTDPRKYFLTVRRQTYRNPYGDALFSRLYWVWFFRTNGWKFWVKWLERFGTPLLLGTTQGNAADMAVALSKAVQDAAVAVGAGSTVAKIEQSGGAGHFENFEHACCARIVKLILGQTLTTDVGKTGGGSMAMAKIHNEVRQDKRDSDVRLVTRAVQRMIEVLWTLNNFPGVAPNFVMQDETGLEIDRAGRDAQLMTAGLKLTASYFAREYDFEEGDIDAAAMNAPPPAPFGQPPKTGPLANAAALEAFFARAPVRMPDESAEAFGARLPEFVSRQSRFTPEQQVIERGIEKVIGDLGSIIADAEIKAAIRFATSPHDLHDRLLALLEDIDAAEFQQVFERALFAADILGYAHADARATPPT